MTPAEPTLLHVPMPDSEQASTFTDTLPMILALGGVLIPMIMLVVWFVVRRRRIAIAYPEEHAFRALSKQMRLRARDIKAVRMYAREQGTCAPIGVLMNEQLLELALESR